MTIVMRPSCWHKTFGPNGLSAPAQGLCLNFFSSITTDFSISSALRWAILDQWSSGYYIVCANLGSFLHGDVSVMYRKVALNIQGKSPMYFCFLNSFCMWYASNEQSRILIRYQCFFCNRKTRWQLPLYSEIHQNVRIYHYKYDMYVPIELLPNSFKIIISMRWNVILNAVRTIACWNFLCCPHDFAWLVVSFQLNC